MKNRNDKGKKQRELHQKKKTQAKTSIRGQAETKYGEVKKPVSFGLTPTGADLINQISKRLGISASEFLEQIARGENELPRRKRTGYQNQKRASSSSRCNLR